MKGCRWRQSGQLGHHYNNLDKRLQEIGVGFSCEGSEK